MYKVYFAINPNFGSGPHPEFNDANFHVVAEVSARNVDGVFHKTQNINSPWIENEGIKVLAKRGFIASSKINDDTVKLRSMAIGDVVKDQRGKAWRCDIVGWSEIK